MPVIRLEVSEDLADLLDAESSLLGFESREAYVRWLVRNRASIAGGPGASDHENLLTEYAQRIGELKEQIETEGPPGEAGAAAPATADGGTAVDSVNLEPRAERIADDSVTELADELSGVQGEAYDELTRRAVKQTREQLGGEAGSGLDYASSTTLDPDGARPGEDIADLDAIEVPGYDEELIARRRRAVGAALAHLRDNGEAKRGDFARALYEEYPAGYESTDGWWDCLKRGLRQVDRVDGAGDDSRIWRFRDYRGRVRVLRD